MKSRTVAGKFCKRWDVYGLQFGENKFPNRDNTNNYCRNPSESAGPWCYVMDEKQEWDWCFNGTVVPECKNIH